MIEKKLFKEILFSFKIIIIFFIILIPFLLFNKNIYIITSNSMYPNLNIGDLIYVEKKNSSNIKVGFNEGDILIIQGPDYYYENGLNPFFLNYLMNNTPIIHRAIDKKIINEKYYFLMKGDNNLLVDGAFKIINISEDYSYFFIEYNKSDAIYVSEEKVLGVYIFKIPYIGYLKIFFPYILILVISIIIILICLKLTGYKIKIIKTKT